MHYGNVKSNSSNCLLFKYEVTGFDHFLLTDLMRMYVTVCKSVSMVGETCNIWYKFQPRQSWHFAMIVDTCDYCLCIYVTILNKPEFTIVLFIHYKPRIAVAILDLKWMKMIWSGWKIEENCHVLVNQFHRNFHSETPSCKKIKSVFRHVKWSFNASWRLKGLKYTLHVY